MSKGTEKQAALPTFCPPTGGSGFKKKEAVCVGKGDDKEHSRRGDWVILQGPHRSCEDPCPILRGGRETTEERDFRTVPHGVDGSGPWVEVFSFPEDTHRLRASC